MSTAPRDSTTAPFILASYLGSQLSPTNNSTIPPSPLSPFQGLGVRSARYQYDTLAPVPILLINLTGVT
jgi:hypothetical protein